MKNIDVPLSEEVATQAGKEINSLKNTIENNKDLQNEILRDYTNDARIANKFIKKVCVILFILLVASIGGLIGMSVYNQHLINKANKEHNQQMIDFIAGAGFETSIDMTADNHSSNNGNINVE